MKKLITLFLVVSLHAYTNAAETSSIGAFEDLTPRSQLEYIVDSAISNPDRIETYLRQVETVQRTDRSKKEKESDTEKFIKEQHEVLMEKLKDNPSKWLYGKKFPLDTKIFLQINVSDKKYIAQIKLDIINVIYSAFQKDPLALFVAYTLSKNKDAAYRESAGWSKTKTVFDISLSDLGKMMSILPNLKGTQKAKIEKEERSAFASAQSKLFLQVVKTFAAINANRTDAKEKKEEKKTGFGFFGNSSDSSNVEWKEDPKMSITNNAKPEKFSIKDFDEIVKALSTISSSFQSTQFYTKQAYDIIIKEIIFNDIKLLSKNLPQLFAQAVVDKNLSSGDSLWSLLNYILYTALPTKELEQPKGLSSRTSLADTVEQTGTKAATIRDFLSKSARSIKNLKYDDISLEKGDLGVAYIIESIQNELAQGKFIEYILKYFPEEFNVNGVSALGYVNALARTYNNPVQILRAYKKLVLTDEQGSYYKDIMSAPGTALQKLDEIQDEAIRNELKNTFEKDISFKNAQHIGTVTNNPKVEQLISMYRKEAKASGVLGKTGADILKVPYYATDKNLQP